MESIYTDETYLNDNPTWHDEDSPWKARQIASMINENKLQPASVAEIGCGGGGVLANLLPLLPDSVQFKGFDIALAALKIAKLKERERLAYYHENMFQNTDVYDVLMCIDVIEHIPDYYSFAQQCREKAKYKIYHIPLEINILSVLRKSFAFTLSSGRNTVGHLHFFTAEYAVMALKETGHTIIDTRLTDGAIALSRLHPSFKRSLANIPRRIIALASKSWAARLLGGYSLLVLCE